MSRLRTAETAQLCDLLVARYTDWIDGTQRPLDLGRRSIRIYDLQRELYGEEVRPPELEECEATFRWRLYRVFNEMAECGGAEQTPEQKARFLGLTRRARRVPPRRHGLVHRRRAGIGPGLAEVPSTGAVAAVDRRRGPVGRGRGGSASAVAADAASSGGPSSTRPIAASSRLTRRPLIAEGLGGGAGRAERCEPSPRTAARL